MAESTTQIKKDIFEDIEASSKELSVHPFSTEVMAVQDDFQKRKYELENMAFEQDMQLKKSTMNRLFWFLAIETLGVFILAFMQGSKVPYNFQIEEWSFNILVSATILQITAMLTIAVKHLFPEKK